MSIAATDAEIEQIGHLDFELPCLLATPPLPRGESCCPDPAAWVVWAECCFELPPDVPTLWCERHHAGLLAEAAQLRRQGHRVVIRSERLKP